MSDNSRIAEQFRQQTALRDAIIRTTGSKVSLSKAASSAFYGINYRSVGMPVKSNSDTHGLTFITRPRLNLSYDNISGVRNFTQLLTDDQFTLSRAVRCLLDPVSNKGIEGGVRSKISSPIIDENNPFMAILSNSIISVSGFPDAVMDTHTSPNGLANESWSMIDSLPNDYSTYDLTLNFRNMSGDPISLIMHIWTQYAARVSEGSMSPWPEAIAENEMDYNCRIYRLVLDDKRKYVQKIAATGYSSPYVNPIGAAFNYDVNQPTITDNKEISVPFKCSGIMYNDPILVTYFNALVSGWNGNMKNGVREQAMVKVPEELKNYFNYSAYPRISEDGVMELEWWVNKIDYEESVRGGKVEFNPEDYIV